ncbi:MAG TPA: hypothetical protein VF581_13120 [Flavobacterium sp.]|jgi:hypothetical protein
MKHTKLKIAVAVAVVGAIMSCESNKKSTITESGTEVVKVRTPSEDTINKTAEPAMETRTVEGTVASIQNGKDGYTAKVESSNNEIFFVTISHANLKEPGQYKSYNVGDKIKVTGDFWKMENDNQITVRQIN